MVCILCFPVGLFWVEEYKRSWKLNDSKDMKIAILAITDKGKQAARMIQAQFPESVIIQGNQGVRKKIEFVWNDYDALICIMATGIVVRCIAHLCKSKFEDPAPLLQVC